jgi:hypothetical protein
LRSISKQIVVRREEIDMEVCHGNKQDNHWNPEPGVPWLLDPDGRHRDGTEACRNQVGIGAAARGEHGGGSIGGCFQQQARSQAEQAGLPLR